MATVGRGTGASDGWSSGNAYEAYVGRWSRLVSVEFLDWLAVPVGQRWLDVGCGTGALARAILDSCDPSVVVGVDASPSFVEHARATVRDARARFELASAAATGLRDGAVDVVVSGLVLNFVPDIGAALAEAKRTVVPGGVVAGYVWDYAHGMQVIRRFWDAAVAHDPTVTAIDEAARFPNAAPEPLAAAFRAAGLEVVETRPIDVPTVFSDFDDLWTPFLRGTGPAPAYVASLTDADLSAVRDRLRGSIREESDGSIRLAARAWAVRSQRAA